MSAAAAANPLQELDAPGDNAAPPPVLLPYQQRWLADEAQLKICEKGRRVGLTWAEAADAVLICASEGGTNYFYISATQDMAREFVEAATMWARAFDYAAGQISEGIYDDGDDASDPTKRYIKTYEVNFPATGRRTVALSSRPTNLRGKQGVIGIDEGAFAPDLAALIKAALAMLLWGDKVRIWSTHDGVENPFNQLIHEVRAGKRGTTEQASVHRVDFGLAVAEGLYRRVCLRRGLVWSQAAEDAWVAQARRFYGDDAPEELDAIPSMSSGAYLSLTLIEQRMTERPFPDGPALIRGSWDDAFAYQPEDVRRFAILGWLAENVDPVLRQLNPKLRHAFGEDFGRSRNLTVLAIGEETDTLGKRLRVVIELFNCPFSCQQQIIFHVVDGLRRFRGGAMDAGGNGAALAEAAAQRYGVEMIEQVKITADFYLQHMPKLKAGLEDGTLYDIPRDAQLRDDLRAIQLIKGVARVPEGDTTKSHAAKAAAAESGQKMKRHGDFAIALLMMVYAFYREALEIDYQPAPGKGHQWDAVEGDQNNDDDPLYRPSGTW